MNCHNCQSDLAGKSHYIEQTGYTKYRPQGGTNQIRHPRPTGRLLCESCIHIISDQKSDQRQSLI